MYQFTESEKLLQECRKYLASGVGSHVRAAAEPILFFERGNGSKVYDVDGNEYIDYLLGYGPIFLGYNHPNIRKAVLEQVESGSQFSSEYEKVIELAKAVCESIPCADMVNFNVTGTEAVQTVIRLARAFTGKRRIIKFEGHYHGWLDNIYVSHLPDSLELLGLENSPRKLLGAAGQSDSSLEDLIVLPWNDLDIVEQTIRERKFEIAAVITEPIMSNCGVIMPKKGYLEGLRRVTESNGVLLIFDEVITGFRVALGGAQELFGITPDLSTFAKAIGGGYPISGYCGRRDIMELVASKKALHAGTYNTNAIPVAAALAVIRTVSANGGIAYERLAQKGKRLSEGIREIAVRHGLPVRVECPGTFLGTVFSEHPIYNLRDSLKPRPDLYPKFRRKLLEKGVYIFPTEKGLWYLSLAHSDEDIDRSLDAVEDVMKTL